MASRPQNRPAPTTGNSPRRSGRERARWARRGLRLNAPPTIVHPDRRQRQREAWRRAATEEEAAAWPR